MGSTDEVNSPTYSIVNEYNTPKGKYIILIFTAEKH
jgi:tRNA A37 threonylcarbamoyladenosine biosynthesis protein TsaE